MHKLITLIHLGIGLTLATSTFAKDNTMSIVNNVKTNIHVEYETCVGDICGLGGGGFSLFGNTEQIVHIGIRDNESIHVKSAQEIDSEHGDPVIGGLSGIFGNACKASAGQKIHLIKGCAPRTVGTILCWVE